MEINHEIVNILFKVKALHIVCKMCIFMVQCLIGKEFALSSFHVVFDKSCLSPINRRNIVEGWVLYLWILDFVVLLLLAWLYTLFSFSMEGVMDPPTFPLASPFVMFPYFELGLVLPFLSFKVLLLLSN
jgi:hypothetical protein